MIYSWEKCSSALIRATSAAALCYSVLLIVVDHLRFRFAYFKLVAHLLDLRCLLFQARGQSLDFLLPLRGSQPKVLLLLRDGRFKLSGRCLEVSALLRNGHFLFLDLA